MHLLTRLLGRGDAEVEGEREAAKIEAAARHQERAVRALTHAVRVARSQQHQPVAP